MRILKQKIVQQEFFVTQLIRQDTYGLISKLNYVVNELELQVGLIGEQKVLNTLVKFVIY